jgi:hypothetical protein
MEWFGQTPWSLVWQGKQRRLEFSFASFFSLKKCVGLVRPMALSLVFFWKGKNTQNPY